jgi:hypothetical protein
MLKVLKPGALVYNYDDASDARTLGHGTQCYVEHVLILNCLSSNVCLDMCFQSLYSRSLCLHIFPHSIILRSSFLVPFLLILNRLKFYC